MTRFLALIRRDIALALRQRNDAVTVVAFFVLAAMLFPFGVGPEPNMLARISAGVIWVTALLAAMLSLDRLYAADFEDGSLELLVLLPMPVEMLVLAKTLAHWLTTGLPLIAAAPVLALFLNMPGDGLGTLLLAMVLGTPILSLTGGVGAALILGARRGGVLLSLLVLPLFIPVLILGTAAVDAAQTGLPVRTHLLLLAALLAGALALTPFATAAAVRQAVR